MTARTDATDGSGPNPARAGVVTPAGVVVALRGRTPATAPAAVPSTGTAAGSFTVDCAGCVHRGTDVCDDCVVTFIVDRDPGDALVVDADEARAVRLLERAGLVPGVRHEARACGD